jgi:UPF0755 protein
MNQPRKSTGKWWFYLFILPLSWGICAWQGWSWWRWASAPVDPDAGETAAVQIEIPPGTPGQQIGIDLAAAELIRSPAAWRLWTEWLSWRRDGGYRAGTYKISPSSSLSEIANKIWQGEVATVSFTIPEGWSRRQIAAHLQEKGYFGKEDFLAATRQLPVSRYPWLPADVPHLEGFLFPDTYKLPLEEMNPQNVVWQMLERFEQIALPVYEQVEGDWTLLEWVTLASIVEREAVVPRERRRIAGVFVNRLRQGMRLEADPTVEYGLGITQTPEKPLTLEQVNTESPYNTYLNSGLPPTPIASPGKASLQATANPEKTEYLYFVARYDGTHVFSRTLAQHQAAQNKIRDRIDNRQTSAAN